MHKLILLTALFYIASCTTGNTDTKKPADTTGKEVNKKPAANEEPPKAPIINISDTISPARTVLCMKDSAATMERVGLKLGEIYGVKLADFLKKNKLNMAGAPMAWYTGDNAPFFFAAGVPVDKKPAKTPMYILTKELKADSALVAHFYGPYSQLSEGYKAVREYAKERKIKISAQPFEIYIGDPIGKDGKPADPYKVQTDIVFTRN